MSEPKNDAAPGAVLSTAGLGDADKKRMRFARVCDLMPEGMYWGDPLTHSMARELMEAGAAEERRRWEALVRVGIEGLSEPMTHAMSEWFLDAKDALGELTPNVE